MPELEPFDARAYLTAGDWRSELARRGWHQAPGDIESVRKDYFSPLGWRIHVWAEWSGPEHDNDARVLAFGLNGDRLGDIWMEHYDVLPVVDQLEKLIVLDQPYEGVAATVARFLGAKLAESDEFDPRDYFAGYTGLMGSLGYESAGMLAFAKTIQTPQVTFKVYVDGASDGHPGYLHVEGRPNDWMATGTWNRDGQFRTLLTHAFENDPPTDYLKQLDAKLTGFSGTFEQIDGELTRDKSTLIALSDRSFKARKRVESLVNKLLDSEVDFDPREYLLDEPSIEVYETVAEYVHRIIDGMGRKLHAPHL